MVRKTTISLASAVFCFGLAHTAAAADVPVKAPAQAAYAAPSWSGFYGGIHVGAGWGTIESTLAANLSRQPGAADLDEDVDRQYQTALFTNRWCASPRVPTTSFR